MPLVRRRRGVLGACGDGADALRDRRGRGAGARRSPSCARRSSEHITDPDERQWVEPRLAHLLGLAEGPPGDQENLFSAWRVLFERLAEQDTVVLVFEDMQWADAGLLDFVEYLLDWSRSHPIFVLVLARPELAEKHPTWGAGKRAVTSLYLEPLSAQAMEELLSGLVPGLPDDLRTQILARAEGVPLYAVETVRMLLDRVCSSARETSSSRPAPSRRSRCPETLHALVAARLDGLTPEERRLVQDAAVLGKTFTKQGLAALTGLGEDELEPPLAALVRKEVLAIQADPRSPERGQYSFLQDIVRHVAYETISQARAEGQAPRGRASTSPRSGARRRTRSSRSSPRTTSTPTGPRRRPRRGRDQGEGARDARSRGRARGVPGRERGGAARFERAAS